MRKTIFLWLLLWTACILTTNCGDDAGDDESNDCVAPGERGFPEILDAEGDFALIYNGVVAAPGAAEAVAEMAEAAGLDIEYFSDVSDLPDLLEGAAVVMIGGTEDDLSPLIGGFTTEILGALTDYLEGGGRYLGICGGAYTASTGWEDTDGFVNALGLLNAETEGYIEESDPMIISVTWECVERPIYYAYGPAFLLSETANVEILATYEDGRIAALLAPYGKGKIALCGPHPEADETWLDDDPEPQDADSWESTTDLANSLLDQLLMGGLRSN